MLPRRTVDAKIYAVKAELAILGLKKRGHGEEVLFEKFFEIVAEKGPFSLQLQEL